MKRFSHPGFLAPTAALSALLALSAAASVSLVEKYEDPGDGGPPHYLEITVDHEDMPASVFLVVGQEQIDLDLGVFHLKVLPQAVVYAGHADDPGVLPLQFPLPLVPLPDFYVQAIAFYDGGPVEASEAIQLSDGADWPTIRFDPIDPVKPDLDASEVKDQPVYNK